MDKCKEQEYILRRIEKVERKVRCYSNLVFFTSAWFDSLKRNVEKSSKSELKYILPFTLREIEKQPEILNYLDETISILEREKKGELNQLKRRLLSMQFNENRSAIFECLTLLFLEKNFGIEEFYPKLKNGMRSDCRLNLSGNIVNVELTQISFTRFEEKLYEIYRRAGERLEKTYPSESLRVYINIHKLKYDKNGYLDVPGSVKKIEDAVIRKLSSKVSNISSEIIYEMRKADYFVGIELISAPTSLSLEPMRNQIVRNIDDELFQLETDLFNVLFLHLGTLADEISAKWDLEKILKEEKYKHLDVVVIVKNYTCEYVIFNSQRLLPNELREELKKIENMKLFK